MRSYRNAVAGGPSPAHDAPERSSADNHAAGQAAIQRIILSPREDSIPHSGAEMDRLGAIQREAAIEFARSVGLPDMKAMMRAQADQMSAQAQKTHTTHQERVEHDSQYQTDESAPLSPDELRVWTSSAGPAIAGVVAYANKHFPDLHLSADVFVLAFEDCLVNGAFAFTKGDGRLSISYQFVKVAEQHPERVISTVVHELHGHPEYDTSQSGNRAGRNLGEMLYRGARALMPDHPQDAESLTDSEFGNYAYQETEMFALLRELPYEVEIPVEERYTNSVEATLELQLGQWRSQWEPRIAAAMVHGFYRRLRATPEITPQAVQLFAKVVQRLWKGDPLLERMLQ